MPVIAGKLKNIKERDVIVTDMKNKVNKKINTKKKTALMFIGIILIITGGCFAYLLTGQYKGGDRAKQSLNSDKVDVTITKEYILFDGSGEENALIFYPGAKVESEAYAPLGEAIAKSGTDCFVLKIPFQFAFFGINQADAVYQKYSYKNWYIGGHSLGGVAAAMYADRHVEGIEGLLLLASYSVSDLTKKEGFRVLSVYGSEDGVLNLKKMEQNEKNLPSDFTRLCIEGGNHAQFGNYGEQKKDGKARISEEEQIGDVVEAWNEWVKK